MVYRRFVDRPLNTNLSVRLISSQSTTIKTGTTNFVTRSLEFSEFPTAKNGQPMIPIGIVGHELNNSSRYLITLSVSLTNTMGYMLNATIVNTGSGSIQFVQVKFYVLFCNSSILIE